MSGDYLYRLARFAVDTRLEELEWSTVAAAKNVILDTLGAMLAGSRQPENANLAGLVEGMGQGGKSTLMGRPDKTQAMLAALANATAGVSLEVDEGTRLGGGHPSIHVTPAALAVAEERGKSGKDLLESVVVGYELISRVGGATTPKSEIHSHGTWGTIGAAAATARMLGFDANETRNVISMAASMSPANTWTPCFEGATIRNLYPGRSNLQGILAAQLGRCGFTGLEDGPSDMYESVIGAGFDPEAAVDGLGQPGSYRIEQNYFKFHACCWYNHPVLDAVLSLVGSNEFIAGQVEGIEVKAPAMALTMTNPEPGNMLSAKFSIPYAVSAAIVHGDTGVQVFHPDELDDPRVRDLARKVSVEADPRMDLRRYDYPTAKVTVTLEDGRVLNENVVAHRGDFRNPAAQDEMEDKFLALAEGTLARERAESVVETVGRLDSLKTVSELTTLLTGD